MLQERLSLPSDITDHIMRFVAADNKGDLLECALVNKAFGTSAVEQLWRTVTLPVNEWDAIKPLFARPQRLRADYRRLVRRLVILAATTTTPTVGSNSSTNSNNSNPNSNANASVGLARFVAGIGPGLRVLVLDAPVFSDDDLWAISSKCPQIESISLASFSAEPQSPSMMGMNALSKTGALGQGRITDDGLISLVSHCKHIKHLRLRALGHSAPLFSERGFDAIAQSCTHLKTFALEWSGSHGGRLSNGNTDKDDQRVAAAICRVLEANKGLTILSLDWCLIGSEFELVVDAACAHLSNLEMLRVGGFHSLSTISPLVRCNPGLKQLILLDMMTTTVSQAEIEMFFYGNGEASFPSEKASPKVTTTTAVSNQLDFTLRLETLELDGTGHILSTLPLVSRFSNLTRLKVAPSRLSASMPFERTDSLVSDAIKVLPNLKYLEIPIVGNGPIFAVTETCSRLEEFDIVDGAHVTDQAIILLVKACHFLKHLHLGSANILTDSSLLVVARTLSTNLLTLTLPFRNLNLTYRVLDELQLCNPNLETLLNLPVLGNVGSGGVTKEAVMSTIPLMRRLKKLGLCFVGVGMQGVFGIFMSRFEIDNLKKQCVRLKTVVMNA
ncbi:UNVERIFIED_CONTAM: hypothetical protein HDU68_004549 [Siphonaria sp. JEL0065]|nr:hypothetical protein HDU68_004549 [Siphonaria sp. JEL0065]